MLVRQGFEKADLPYMGKFMHDRFHAERKSILVCQTSEFPIVSQDDFGIARLGPFFLVDRFCCLIVSIPFRATEFLEFLCRDMPLDSLGDGFRGGVAVFSSEKLQKFKSEEQTSQ